MNRSRFAGLFGALSLSLLLSGCGPYRLHILIPDFQVSGVDGLQLYRVLASGSLENAGRIVFGSMLVTPTGLQLQYSEITPEKVFGPLTIPVEKLSQGQLSLELAFFNSGAPGYFRFASYNERGTSALADGQVYAATAQP